MVKILTTICRCLFLTAFSSTSSLHNTFCAALSLLSPLYFRLLSLSVSKMPFSHSPKYPSCLSLPSPSLWSHLFFLLSPLSLLVISTCQAKGSRQMDGQMNTQICREAKRMMERWNKGVTVRDSAQLSPVQGLGGSGGGRGEEQYRQKGEKWRKRYWRRMDFKAISIVPYLVVTGNNPWHNDVNKCHFFILLPACCQLIKHNSDSSFCYESSYTCCCKHPLNLCLTQANWSKGSNVGYPGKTEELDKWSFLVATPVKVFCSCTAHMHLTVAEIPFKSVGPWFQREVDKSSFSFPAGA